MGNQKLKWTPEEEEALLAGVGKHGPGKWKNILRDPEFADQLHNRSNIDLKDKWRNLSVAPGIQGSKDKLRTPKVKAVAFQLASDAAAAAISPAPSGNSSPFAPLPRSGSSDLSVDAKNAPRYDGMIFEAISALADENGSAIGAILNFIEQNHEVPGKFRRTLNSRLTRLAAQGKLEKNQNCYKRSHNSSITRTQLAARPKEITSKSRPTNNQKPVATQERVGEASITAAYKLVEVENKLDLLKSSAEDVEKMTLLQAEAEYILLIAKEMHEECKEIKKTMFSGKDCGVELGLREEQEKSLMEFLWSSYGVPSDSCFGFTVCIAMVRITRASRK